MDDDFDKYDEVLLSKLYLLPTFQITF